MMGAALLSGLWAGFVWSAATTPAPSTLSALWQELQQNSPLVALADADVQEADARVATAAPLWTNPELELEGSMNVFLEGDFDVGVALQQELPLPFERWARVEGAAHHQSAARVTRQNVDATLGGRLVVAVARVAAARAHEDAARLQRDVALRLAEAAVARETSGTASPADVLTAEADAAQAEALALTAAGVRAGAEHDLRALLGRDTDAPLVVEWPTVVVATAAPAEHPRVKSAALLARAAERDEDAASLARLPPLTVTAGIGYGEDYLRVIGGGGGTAFDDDVTGMVRVGVPLPSFDLGRGAVLAAQAARARADATARQVQLETRAEVKSAEAAFQAAKDGAVALAAADAKVDDALAKLLAAHDQGAVSLEQLLVARDRLLLVRRAAIDAREQEAVAAARVRVARGENPVNP